MLLSDSEKAIRRQQVTLICALVYGAFVLIAVAPAYLFMSDMREPALMKIAGGLYTLTLLPAAVAGFFFKRASGVWMLFVSFISLIALWHDTVVRYRGSDGQLFFVSDLVWWGLVAAIPGVMGFILARSKRPM